MLGAEGVPQAERAAEGEVDLVDVVIGATVAAVDVAGDRRRKQGVVQRRVQVFLHIGRRIHLNAGQGLPPFHLGVGANGVERGGDRRPLPAFAVEIGDGAGFIDIGNGDFDDQRAVDMAEIELRHQRAAIALSDVIGTTARALEAMIDDVRLGVLEGMAGQGRRETHGEEQLAVRRPAARLARAGDRAIGPQAHGRPQDLARVVVDAGAQVDDQMRRLAGREGIAMDADARAGGQLGAHAAVGQSDRIITGLGGFGLVVIGRAIAGMRHLGIARLGRYGVAGDRHDQDIAQVGMAGAGEMGVREAHDGRVFVAIARGDAIALLERANIAVGTELHHAERGGCAGIGVTTTTGADHRVDRVIPRRILACCLGMRATETQGHHHSHHTDRFAHMSLRCRRNEDHIQANHASRVRLFPSPFLFLRCGTPI